MKKSASSINNNRDINSSQRKRMRSTTPARENEEDVTSQVNTDVYTSSSQKKVKKGTSENLKDKKLNDMSNHAGRSTTSTSTPCGSSISFSSSSPQGPTSTNNNKATRVKSNSSTELKEKKRHVKQLGVNDSVISKKKSSEKPLTQTSKKLCPSNTTTSGSWNGAVTSQSKIVSSPLTSRENVSSRTINSSQRVNDVNLSRSENASSSTSLNGSNSNKSIFSVDASIEGSLEYRELKRMYLHERNQAEEWRKDYYVIKKQLAKVKATTIPRPNAEVLEWLEELLYLINNNDSFIGDGHDLKQIGTDLGLDEASLLTVTARTPQKSALKLFRLLYSTVTSRAKCVSISEMCQTQLQNIYCYIRNLHKNLNFSKDDMRKAIGTSIRCARRDIKKQQDYQQQRADAQNDQEDPDLDDRDEGIDDTINEETTFNQTEDILDEVEDGDDEDIENEDNVITDEELDNDIENEDNDQGLDTLLVDGELDEDSD